MNGPSKADRIRELLRDGTDMSGKEIAEEVGTTPQYVYEINGRMDNNQANQDNGDTPDADLPESDGDADLGDLRDDDNDPGGADVNPDGPLGDLIISDEWEEYECSECEATVEYLQEECDECGEKLAWWADA